jgi:hypothetical protein
MRDYADIDPEFPISTLSIRENHTYAALARQVQNY